MFDPLGPLDVVLRLGAATLAGLVIGFNRGRRNKPVGMRTLALVSLGAATVAVGALQVDGMLGHPDAASRVVQGVIQGIMTGISFVGAGVILRDSEAGRIKGLTTAATVWMSAALGIACGLGGWHTAAIALVIALFVLVVIRWIERLTGRDEGDEDGTEEGTS
jgi:putative Mg2+ transporter-C (MgtC) family protein